MVLHSCVGGAASGHDSSGLMTLRTWWTAGRRSRRRRGVTVLNGGEVGLVSMPAWTVANPLCAGVRTGFDEHREKSQMASCRPTMMLHVARLSSLEALSTCYSTYRFVIVG